jgi:hypothetical protein
MVSGPIAAVNITDGYLPFQEKFKFNNSFHNSKITTMYAATAFLIVIRFVMEFSCLPIKKPPGVCCSGRLLIQ